MKSRWCRVINFLASFLLDLVYLFVCFVPVNKKLWLFSAWGGEKYLDNPKYIYKYVNKLDSDISAVWLTKNKKVSLELLQKGMPVVYAYSIQGIFAQLRAGVVVYTHAVSMEFLPVLVGPKAKRVLTWHGIPIKKIGHDVDGELDTRARERLYSALFPFLTKKSDLVLAAGLDDSAKYSSALTVRPEDVKITGYPRNDEILNSMGQTHLFSTYKVIYMPTLRGAPSSAFRLNEITGLNIGVTNSHLRLLGIELYIKLHPVNRFDEGELEAIACCSNIFSLDNEGDIYETIGKFDALITDFSGIYFDYMITNKPIVMAPFKMDLYLEKDRTLYYQYDDICPAPPCHTWDAILERIVEYKNGTVDSSDQYAKLKSRFHRYSDANSSERVFLEIRKLINL